MRRSFVGFTALLTLLASVGNPHLLAGGANDVYGLAPWWQVVGALLDLVALLAGATLLWRGSGAAALALLLGEMLLFAVLNAAAVLTVGLGHFQNGWGGGFVADFAVAFATRGTLVLLAELTLIRAHGTAEP